MKRPRIRIGTLMLLVALVALPLSFLATRARWSREAERARRVADLRERTVRAQALRLSTAGTPSK